MVCIYYVVIYFFFFSSRRRHTRSKRDWSSDVCSSDLASRAHVQRAEELESQADIRSLKHFRGGSQDRKSVVWGKRVDLGGRRIIKKKKKKKAVKTDVNTQSKTIR